VSYGAFPSPEAARDLQQELPWELDSGHLWTPDTSGLLWTPRSATLGTAGKKNPSGEAHAEISE